MNILFVRHEINCQSVTFINIVVIDKQIDGVFFQQMDIERWSYGLANWSDKLNFQQFSNILRLKWNMIKFLLLSYDSIIKYLNWRREYFESRKKISRPSTGIMLIMTIHAFFSFAHSWNFFTFLQDFEVAYYLKLKFQMMRFWNLKMFTSLVAFKGATWNFQSLLWLLTQLSIN